MPPLIALAIGRLPEILKGIAHYLEEHERWLITFAPHWATHIDADEFKAWGGEGVIIQATASQPLEVIARSGRFGVNVSDDAFNIQFPTVRSDNVAVGRLGAEYLLGRGFRNFMFILDPGRFFSHRRLEGFAGKLGEVGLGCTVLECRHHQEGMFSRRLHGLLAALPRPLAILATGDIHARLVARQCLELGVRVPDDIAILGVNNAEELCRLDFVPLSSIELNTHRIGWLAAEAMQSMLQSGRVVPFVKTLPPVRVVTRQSTDILAVHDADVHAGLEYITRHAAEAISIEQVADAVGVSRRTLDRKFIHYLKRTPAEELMLAKLNLARKLLRTTDLPMSEIAQKAGFSNQQHLSKSFRSILDTTPSAYRRQCSQQDLA